jgi:hypothetical protein
MIGTIVAKVKGFLASPVETFRNSKADEPSAVFTYFVALLLVSAVFSAIIALLGINRMSSFSRMAAGTPHPVLVFFGVLIGGFILTLIFAAWLHLWAYILGARQGIMQTVRVVLYGSTPWLLFGWIPFIGFIFMLWSLVLGVIGIGELQELSSGKVVLAFVIAVLIPLIIIFTIAMYFISSYAAVMSAIPLPPTNGM